MESETVQYSNYQPLILIHQAIILNSFNKLELTLGGCIVLWLEAGINKNINSINIINEVMQYLILR